MLKKICCFLLLSCCISSAQGLTTSADSAILMEFESGRVLYEENINEEKLIASITKLMTALVALESDVPLQEKIEITAESYAVEGSSLYLELGEKISLEALLYGLLLHSGNDAAVAISIACGGTEEAFVASMNEKAKELGMNQSHFSNPHGLNDTEHYSTAYDMALLARACLENEVLADMVATEKIQISNRSFTNKNKLLWNYEGCIGMKTGYTELAGRTLVSAAERDGMTLICVTLNDRNDWVDHSALFDYGFDTYEMVSFGAGITAEIPAQSSLVSFVTAEAQERFRYPLATGEQVSWEVWGDAQPIKEGAASGVWGIFYQNQIEIFRLPLIYTEEKMDVVTEPEGFWDKWKERMGAFFH